MRIVLALLLLFTAPAFAAEWSVYSNERFGYAIEVPPDFVPQPEADNGDGRVFRTPTASLTVFGSNVVEADFEASVRQRQAYLVDDGWAITYQVTTPRSASYSGKNGAHIMYARMIALCGGTQFAMFELEYFAADLERFDPVVDRLVRKFRATGPGL